MKSLIDIIN